MDDNQELSDALAELDITTFGSDLNTSLPNPGSTNGRGVQDILRDLGVGSTLPQGAFPLSDTGNAQRFVHLYGDVVRYAHESRTWYVWEGTNWEPDPHGVAVMALTLGVIQYMRVREVELLNEDAAADLARFAAATESETARRKIPVLVQSDRRIWVRESELNVHRHLIATKNGTFDVLKNELRPSRPTDLITRCTGVPYDPAVLDNPPEMIKRFTADFLPEEGRPEHLMRLLGSALYGGNQRRLFTIIRGKSTSGKTMLVMALQAALGDYAASSQATIFRNSRDDAPRPDIIRLYPKRLVFMAEASRSWKLQASRIKLITGGDHDPQRAMRSNAFHEGQPEFMPVIYTNDLPTIVGLDEATKRRLVVVLMDHTIPVENEDATIKERFIADPEVQRWMLAALIRGCVESRDPVKMSEALEVFQLSTNVEMSNLLHLADFMEWLTEDESPQLYRVTDPDELVKFGVKATFVAQTELYARYVQWVETAGDRDDHHDRLSLRAFNRQLKDDYGFVAIKSGKPRWEGYRLRQFTIKDAAAIANYAPTLS